MSVTIHRNNFFVAGSSIMKSHDGIEWKTIYTGDQQFNKIKSLNDKRLVAIGTNLVLFSDDDGKSWHIDKDGKEHK